MNDKIHNCPLGHSDVEHCQPREGSMTQYDFCRCNVCGFTAETHVWQQQAALEAIIEKEMEARAGLVIQAQRHAFLSGAKWWEFYSTKGTMWQSDQKLVWEIAISKFPTLPEETLEAEEEK